MPPLQKRIFLFALFFLSFNSYSQEQDYAKLDADGLNMFHKAILARDFAAMSYLAQSGQNLNILTADGRTPLQLGLYAKDHSEQKDEEDDGHIKFLMRFTNYQNLGSFEAALEFDHPNIALAILSKGLDFDPETADGKRIVRKAIESKGVGPAIIEMATKRRFINAMTQTADGAYLYQHMISNAPESSFAVNYLAAHVDEITSTDPKSQFTSTQGKTYDLRLLDILLYHQQLEPALVLVKKGVPLNTSSPFYDDMGVLSLLYRRNHPDDTGFRQLLELFIDSDLPMITDSNGRMGMHEAAIKLDLRGIKMMLAAKNIWYVDKEGNRWLHYYMQHMPDDGILLGRELPQLYEMAKPHLPVQNKAGIPAFFLLKDARQFQQLTQYPELLRLKTKDGSSLLQYKLDWLREKGARVEETSTGYSFTPSPYYQRDREGWNQIMAMFKWLNDNNSY